MIIILGKTFSIEQTRCFEQLGPLKVLMDSRKIWDFHEKQGYGSKTIKIHENQDFRDFHVHFERS